jgi:hypothetical protein
VLLCVLALAVPAQAQWTWRDKDGRINASDRPPPRDVPDKDILTRPAVRATAARTAASAASAAASTAATAPQDRELEARKKAAEQDRAAKGKADEERVNAQRADNCRRARSQLAQLESGQRLSRINDKGEREVLDEPARNAELQRAREVIAADCR